MIIKKITSKSIEDLLMKVSIIIVVIMVFYIILNTQ